MPPRKTVFQSLMDHLIKQVSWVHQARRIRPETFNDLGPWAGLKLYSLHHRIHVYATILHDWLARPGMDTMVYIDISRVQASTESSRAATSSPVRRSWRRGPPPSWLCLSHHLRHDLDKVAHDSDLRCQTS